MQFGSRRLWFAYCFWILLSIIVLCAKPALALPEFARRYGVGCATCHSVPPRLNQFGLAFQANHFNWPGEMKLTARKGLQSLPLSAITTASYANNFTADSQTTDFRDLILFAADSLRLNGLGQGGFFVKTVAATNVDGEHAGDLFDAFAALPVSGRQGQV